MLSLEDLVVIRDKPTLVEEAIRCIRVVQKELPEYTEITEQLLISLAPFERGVQTKDLPKDELQNVFNQWGKLIKAFQQYGISFQMLMEPSEPIKIEVNDGEDFEEAAGRAFKSMQKYTDLVGRINLCLGLVLAG